MEKEEIKHKILSLLHTTLKDGGMSSQIVKKLGFIEGTGDAQRTYKSLEEMRNDESVRYFEKGKMIIHYLPENEEMTRDKWNHKKELDNIDCGYLFIHQGFFTKKEGTLLSVKGYVSAEELVHSDLLDKFSDVEDDSDYLFFWVNNRNALSIDNVIAKMTVVPVYFKPLTSKKKVTFGCDYKIDYGKIEIISDKIFPKSRAYALIPIERLNKHIELVEDISELKVWYDNYPIDRIKGGEVTTNLSSRTRIILE